MGARSTPIGIAFARRVSGCERRGPGELRRLAPNELYVKVSTSDARALIERKVIGEEATAVRDTATVRESENALVNSPYC